MDTAQKISEKNKGDLETWPAAAVTEDPDVFVLKKNVYLKFPKQNTFGFPPSLYFILSFQLLFHKKHLHVHSNFNTFNSTWTTIIHPWRQKTEGWKHRAGTLKVASRWQTMLRQQRTWKSLQTKSNLQSSTFFWQRRNCGAVGAASAFLRFCTPCCVSLSHCALLVCNVLLRRLLSTPKVYIIISLSISVCVCVCPSGRSCLLNNTQTLQQQQSLPLPPNKLGTLLTSSLIAFKCAVCVSDGVSWLAACQSHHAVSHTTLGVRP